MIIVVYSQQYDDQTLWGGQCNTGKYQGPIDIPC